MYIIGENIHIISDNVKEALTARDAVFFQELATAQVEAGAQALDLNLGPRKKDWEEVFPWMVQVVEAAVDVPLCLDPSRSSTPPRRRRNGSRRSPRSPRSTGLG